MVSQVIGIVLAVAVLLGFLWLVMRWQARPRGSSMKAGKQTAAVVDELAWAAETIQKHDARLPAWRAKTGLPASQYGPWLEETDPDSFAEMSRAWRVMYDAGFVEVRSDGTIRIRPNPYLGGTPGY